MDMGINYPFSYLPADDVTRFPYAILEVKLQTQFGTESPQWVDELVKSHLVEEVPKFSKFIHGISTLLDKRVSLLPFWLPQMDKDIRKPAPEGYISPLTGRPPKVFDEEQAREKKEKGKERSSSSSPTPRPAEVEITVDDENDESAPLLPKQVRFEKPKSTGLIGILKQGRDLLSSSASASTSAEASTSTPKPNKRIVLPVRIEPKVFFANERTFLSWLHCTFYSFVNS
jgi:hypothetical protein